MRKKEGKILTFNNVVIRVSIFFCLILVIISELFFGKEWKN